MILLLPVIAVYGLFGWMSGVGMEDIANYDMIYNQFPTEQRELMERYEKNMESIASTFEELGLTQSDISKAEILYISCLVGKENEFGFYRKLADCFLNQTEASDLLTNISFAFGVTFSDAERQQFENLYS